MKGKLICIEGIDGSGKTTQVNLLAKALRGRGYDVVILREPTDGVYGRKIRKMIEEGKTDPEELFELFLKDRKENIEKNILPALKNGKIVIMDRYYISTLVYQSEVGIERILEAHEKISAPKPDLVIILDIPVDEALRRLKVKSCDSFERREILEKHRKQYEKIAKYLREKEKMNVVIIDATGSEEEVHKKVLREVLEVIKN